MGTVRSEAFDGGEALNGSTGFDDSQTAGGFAMEEVRADAVAGGQVGFELIESFVELAGGTERIVALVVVEGGGEVDEALEEGAVRLSGGAPEFLENFVAAEEFAAVEEADSLFEQRMIG